MLGGDVMGAAGPGDDEPAPAERLSIDDQASRTEASFLAAALGAARQAAALRSGTPGVCRNCACRCMPLAAYCDEDCRADHQHRLTVLARQGRGGTHGA